MEERLHSSSSSHSGHSDFQLDETGGQHEFRVVRQNRQGDVVGDFQFAVNSTGDVEILIRRFDESQMGSVSIKLV